jgi:hypothetical protein
MFSYCYLFLGGNRFPLAKLRKPIRFNKDETDKVHFRASALFYGRCALQLRAVFPGFFALG